MDISCRFPIETINLYPFIVMLSSISAFYYALFCSLRGQASSERCARWLLSDGAPYVWCELNDCETWQRIQTTLGGHNVDTGIEVISELEASMENSIQARCTLVIATIVGGRQTLLLPWELSANLYISVSSTYIRVSICLRLYNKHVRVAIVSGRARKSNNYH